MIKQKLPPENTSDSNNKVIRSNMLFNSIITNTLEHIFDISKTQDLDISAQSLSCSEEISDSFLVSNIKHDVFYF